MIPSRSGEGGELARLTPEQKLAHALKEYAQATTNGTSVVVTDWAAVLYLEEVEPDGSLSPRYCHLVSRKSSQHALRGLVLTLVEYIARLRH